MKLSAEFPGETMPFEGDRTVMIRRLPAGAQVQSARVTVTPAAAPGGELFTERLVFSGNQGDFRMTKVVVPSVDHPAPAEDEIGFVEVDFHTRRTLGSATGTALTGSELLVDLGGGVFMPIDPNGALAGQDDTVFYQVPVSGVLPGLTVNKFRLMGAATRSPDVAQVTVRTAPSNVSLALGQLAPFWTHLGEMTSAQVSDDFADFLNLFLPDADVVDGFYEIPLVVHTDALARLSLSVEMDYVVQQSALPKGVSDVALPYAHDTTAQAGSATIAVALPLGAEVTSAGVRITGSFESSRIAVGPTGPLPALKPAEISPERGQAQPVKLEKDHTVAATAVDLLLSCVDQAAVLDLNVLGDVNGRPFGDPLLPEPVIIELDRDLAERPTWLSARLPETFQFPAGQRVWLAVQAREGKVNWHTVPAKDAVQEADSAGLHYSSSAGLTWRATRIAGTNGTNGLDDGLRAGLFRLRHVPPDYQVPVEVQVGEGEAAVRVSLDRYQGLGRIDFNIDFPEFVAAINESARLTAAPCPLGEQLGNGDFARWTTVGEEIGAPQPAAGAPDADAVVVAPNGEWLFAGSGEMNRSEFRSLPFFGLLSSANAGPSSPQQVAARAGGEGLYLLTAQDGDEAFGLAALTPRAMPTGFGAPPSVTVNEGGYCLALSRDGRQLYVGSRSAPGAGGEVRVVDTAILDRLLGDATESLDQAVVATLPLPNQGSAMMRPNSLAPSVDGRRLFVAAAATNADGAVIGQGRLFVFDTATSQELTGGALFIGVGPHALALSPDGRWALVTNEQDDSVTVVDATGLRLTRALLLPNQEDMALETSHIVTTPNGRYAFVATRRDHAVTVLDMATWTLRRPVVIGEAEVESISLAVTPAGDRLYIALRTDTDGYYYYYAPSAPNLYTMSLGRQLPEQWALTQGFIQPLPIGEPYHLTALLGPVTEEERTARPSRPSSLSQVVAASTCTYDFSFWGIASAAGATAEIIWRGEGCSQQRVDRIPLQEAERQNRPEITTRRTGPVLPELALHRRRLEAPPGTTQAEIRFIVPPEENAVVDTVSFMATGEAVANGDLLEENEDGEIVGWQVLPATATAFTVSPGETGTQLGNLGSEPVAVVQSFPVTAGQPFALLFQGEVTGPPASGLQASGLQASLELHWLGAGDAPTGQVTSLAVLAGEKEHRLQASVPADAAAAELHLVLPPGATLVVQRVSFVPVELVTVPISFVAEAPGDLSVLGFDYSYDAPESRPAPTPAGGLCAPTPPGRPTTGGKGGACQWCPSPCGPCEEDETAAEPEHAHVATLPLPGPVRSLGRATRTTRPLAAAHTEATLAAAPPLRGDFEPPVATLMAAPAELAVRAPELAAASVALTEIGGIGPGRSAALAALGIRSLPQLAEAEPALIERSLQGVSLAMARAFVAEARSRLANTSALPPPLVSCVMPTFNRRAFVPRAIALFQRQDYENRELIVVDDGDDPVEDLLPEDERIRYVRLETRRTIGQKTNLAIEAARGGIIAHWDDDVWYAPTRLSYQAAALIEREADLVGLDNWLKYDPFTNRAWHVVRPPGDEPWMPGLGFCYRRSLWQAKPFSERPIDFDIAFLRRRAGAKIVPLEANTWLVDIIHGENVSPQDPRSPLWFAFPMEEIRRLLGEDFAFYERLLQPEV